MRPYGASVDDKTDGKMNLTLAVESRDLDWILGLLRHGAEVNAKGMNDWTALHTAVFTAPFDWITLHMVRSLLRKGADCQAVTETGERPLDVARSIVQLRAELENNRSWKEVIKMLERRTK